MSLPLRHSTGKGDGTTGCLQSRPQDSSRSSAVRARCLLGFRTWRPSKPIRPCRHSGRLPFSPRRAPASGAARQLPPSTAAGVGAAVGRARSLPSSRPRRVSSGRRARQGAGTAGLCLPWPRACGASRGAASGCCWVSSPGCSDGGGLGRGGQHLNAPYSGHGFPAGQ